MNVIILGATGQVSRFLIPRLLQDTDANLTLFGRNVTSRLEPDNLTSTRTKLIDGDILESTKLLAAMEGQDLVFLNAPEADAMQATATAMKAAGIKRLIVSGTIGLYDEVGGKFGEWGRSMAGMFAAMNAERDVIARLLDDPEIDFTYIRMTMLYNNADKTDYTLIPFGTPVTGAQVSRQAVARFITDMIQNPELQINQNVAIIETGSENMDKPSFY